MMNEIAQEPVEQTATVAELSAASPGYWAYVNAIKLQDGNFGFKGGHEYQTEPMDSVARRKCVCKGTQGGFTQIEILVDLHGCIYGRYPTGVLHMMPTGDDVSEFSKSRFGPLVASNRKTIGKFVRDTDTTTLKQVGSSFLYLRGARLNQKVAGEAEESSKLRSISVDRLVFDEFDLMDKDVVEKARGRMGHSEVKEEVYISNPTLPDYGIDLVFKQSDQRYWFRKCGSCGKYTCAELSFPKCVKLYAAGQSPNKFRGYVACDYCGAPVGLSDGEWVAQAKENSEFMAGYRWSQLTSIYNDPYEILDAYNNPPEGNLADVYRMRLGLPYVAAEDRLQESQVYACCGDYLPPDRHEGPAAMGVDVGKIKHVVIGLRIGNDQYRLLRTVAVSEWNDIHDLAKRYGVRSAVIDIRPYEDSARAFQKSEPYSISLCEYSETQPTGAQWNQQTGIVKVNRTELCDKTHRMIVTAGMLKIPRVCQETKTFVSQVCSCAKVLEENKRTHTAIYRYKPVGTCGDHFRHALGYFSLAASAGKIGRAEQGGSRVVQTRSIHRFNVGCR